MKISGTFIRAACVCATALIAACSGGELVAVAAPEPVSRSGSVAVSISAAPAGLAAMRLRVVGGGISAPLAGFGVRILLQRTVADTTVFVLSLSGSTPAPLLTLALLNIDRSVTVVVEEATGGRNAGYAALRAADVTVAIARQ